MMKPTHTRAALALLVTTALGGLTLAACDKTPAGGQAGAPSAALPAGALPLDPNASAAAYVPAPAAAALPAAPPARRISSRAGVARYDYVNRAAQLNGAFADSPPDYTVNYQGARPWYWRARDGAYRVVENTAEGQRYYYYNPGEDQPYLVRDSSYAYGFDQGGLAVVYDSDGRPLSDGEARQRAYLAGQYLARAQALYLAAERERHEAAYASNWAAASAALAAQRQDWDRQLHDNPDWRAWRDRQGPPPADWRAESAARQAYAAGYVQGARQSGPPALTQAPVPVPAPPPAPRPVQPAHAPAPPAHPPAVSVTQDQARQIQAEDAARQTQKAARAREQKLQAQAQAQAQAAASVQSQIAARTRLADQAQRQQARAQDLARAQAARQAEVQARVAADSARRQQLQADAVQARQAEQARAQQAGQKQAELARRKAAVDATAARDAPRPAQPQKPDGHPQR